MDFFFYWFLVCEYGIEIIEIIDFIFDHYDAFRYLVLNLKKPLGTTAKVLTKFFLFKQR
jgi:hypothetical protein